MTSTPAATIVIPVFNDEATIAAALKSCLAQSLSDIEVICVDDASTDGTVAIIEKYCALDERIHLIRHDTNLSALQSRRTGILAAQSDHVLFLDGDDELVAEAAQKAVSHARSTGADLVGFGVTVVEKGGRTGGSYERRLQPKHRELKGDAVLTGLFPIGQPAQGQLWRYMFRTQLLRDAYELMPTDLRLPRINDLPVMFLVAALATKYASIDDHLYRYHFGRGGSGHRVDSVERGVFYSSAIISIDSISDAVSSLARGYRNPELLHDSYDSARLSIIGYVCFQLIERSDEAVLHEVLVHLYTLTPTNDIIRACAKFYPETLTTLKFHVPQAEPRQGPVHSVLLVTSTLRTGGVSAVIASQARYLQEAGYRVTVVARSGGSDPRAIPDGASFVELTGRNLPERLKVWGEICHAHEVDVVIDHQVLYTPSWPEFALMARAEGASTVGWVHNFIARPIYDGNSRLSLIEKCSNALEQLVVLSPLDVAYFKLRGVAHTSFLPNPPSHLLQESTSRPATPTLPSGRIELVWWGRLEQHTKQVFDLIDVGVHLERLGANFRITVIGPDWDDMTAKKFNAQARQRNVDGRVVAVGPMHGTQLLSAIDSADVFISTSVIEGYQLTIAEAQSRGLPVVMYELPWLTLVHDNDGIIAVPQGDSGGLARAVVDIVSDSERYARTSRAALVAAQRASDFDFATLYRKVVTGELPPEFSPEPTLEDARLLLGLIVNFAERSHEGKNSRSSDGSSLGARAWQSASPIGRAALQRLPGLRPLAHRAKTWLGAR